MTMAESLGKFEWLRKEGAPKMLVELLSLYGTKETLGSGNNPEILSWAKELGLKDYTNDAIAWCGLTMAIVAKRADKIVPKEPLWALNWRNFGAPVSEAMLGDVLVFTRNGGGHVTMYVGENDDYYFCLGGNQSDMINITKIPKSRTHWVRRPVYSIAQPDNVRKVRINDSGAPTSSKES